MPSTEILLTGDKYPVRLGSTGGHIARRVQSFNVDRQRTVEEDYELGTVPPIGVGVGPWAYSGSLSSNPIDTAIERVFVGKATATDEVTLLDLMAATGIYIEGKDDGIGGSIIQSVEYTIQVPNGKWTARYNFRGTSLLSGVLALGSPASGGVSSYKSPQAFVRFGTMPGGATYIPRIRQVTINAQFRANDDFEVSNSSPFNVEITNPQITARIEWYNNVLSPADPTDVKQYRPMPESGSGDDMEVQIIPTGLIGDWDDPGNIRIKVFNLVAESNSKQQQLGQAGSRTISYRSEGDATTGGFSVRVLPTP